MYIGNVLAGCYGVPGVCFILAERHVWGLILLSTAVFVLHLCNQMSTAK